MHSPEYLSECLSYDPETGLLTWRERPIYHFEDGKKSASHQAAIWNAQHAGKAAFQNVGNHGYATSSIKGKRMTAHRVAWAIHYGEMPAGEIDHINGNPLDNRIENLRCVSRKENAKNLSVRSGESRGVYWYAPTSRWTAKIHTNGRMIHLGYFKDKSEAIRARRKAEQEFGFHENHGRQSACT